MERHPSPEKHGLRSARFRAVGDLMIHRKQLEIARQPDGTYDFHPQFALIAEALGRADYTIANLETTIGKFRDVPYSGFPRFNTPEALLDALRDAGVDFLSLANNHILDRFFEGLVTTVDRVEARGFDFLRREPHAGGAGAARGGDGQRYPRGHAVLHGIYQ